MNEFMSMTNKEIRKRAWELCREHFWHILSATFLMSLISSVTMELALWTESSIIASLGLLAITVLSTIMSLGLIRFVLDVWHGTPSPVATLFSQKHRFWTTIGSGLLLSLIVFGILLAAMLISLLAVAVSETLGAIIAVVAVIAAIVLMFWIALRFELTTVCIVLNHSMGPINCMRTSWRASKGSVKRLFCNGFVLNLPLAIAQLLLTGFQASLLLNGQTLNTFGSILLQIASTLLTALLSGYIYLGTYALHEQLLENYASNHPVQSAAEMWNEPNPTIELPAAEDDEYEETDEYEDDEEEEEN